MSDVYANYQVHALHDAANRLDLSPEIASRLVHYAAKARGIEDVRKNPPAFRGSLAKYMGGVILGGAGFVAGLTTTTTGGHYPSHQVSVSNMTFAGIAALVGGGLIAGDYIMDYHQQRKDYEDSHESSLREALGNKQLL